MEQGESSMAESTKEQLMIEHAAAQRSQLPEGMDFHCAGPGCTNVIRKPRVITVGTTIRCTTRQGQHADEVVPLRRVHWSWCSQACFDAWNAQWIGKIPGPHWPVYDEAGELIAYVVTGRGRIPIEEIDAAQDGADATQEASE